MAITRFGDVVNDIKLNVDRANNPYEFYIAGDHMDTEELKITRKGVFATDDVGPAFIRIFKKGQVLYGSRRTYLKKVAVADFDGITSNTTFVLETKDNNVFLQELLPFLMLSDKFTEYSVGKSKGSTNPYILFSDLVNFEFDLPSIEEQKRLAKILMAAEETRQAYKKLIKQMDELVKSKFKELFGEIGDTNKFPRQQWMAVVDITNGKDHKKISGEGPYGVYGTGGRMLSCKEYMCGPGTIIMGRKGTIDKPYIAPEKCWIVDTAFGVNPIDTNVLNPIYLYFYTKQIDYTKLNKACTLPSTTKNDLLQLWINVPPIGLQNAFATFVQQAERTKLATQQSLYALNETVRALVNRNFN